MWTNKIHWKTHDRLMTGWTAFTAGLQQMRENKQAVSTSQTTAWVNYQLTPCHEVGLLLGYYLTMSTFKNQLKLTLENLFNICRASPEVAPQGFCQFLRNCLKFRHKILHIYSMFSATFQNQTTFDWLHNFTAPSSSSSSDRNWLEAKNMIINTRWAVINGQVKPALIHD